jgi:hypothetical protein
MGKLNLYALYSDLAVVYTLIVLRICQQQLDLVPVPKPDATKAFELVKLQLYAFLVRL